MYEILFNKTIITNTRRERRAADGEAKEKKQLILSVYLQVIDERLLKSIPESIGSRCGR